MFFLKVPMIFVVIKIKYVKVFINCRNILSRFHYVIIDLLVVQSLIVDLNSFAVLF